MKEILRQLVHLIFGLGLAYLILILEQEVSTAILALGIFVGFVLSDAAQRGIRMPLISPLLDRLEREDVIPGKGALFFVTSALICLILFDRMTVFIGVFVLSVLDSIATIAGCRFGRTPLFHGKTAEGSFIAVAATGILLLPYLPGGLAITVAVIAGLIELLSPVDDNLILPVGVCLLLTLFS
jgi:phytol kinase